MERCSDQVREQSAAIKTKGEFSPHSSVDLQTILFQASIKGAAA
jgi:hypothetical protein